MPARTKRIFISDVHLGDDRSMAGPHPYGWFKDNIHLLAQFLEEQRKAADVKEVIILGDLFDSWIIPANDAPLTGFENICSNPANQPILESLRALAAGPDMKLTYVPGNHDMGMDVASISATKHFLEMQFPGICCLSDAQVPLGRYHVGSLVADHGNRYCLFNAPDFWTNSPSFLPLGYFISRLMAYKVSMTGEKLDYLDIFIEFLEHWKKKPAFVKDMFMAIAEEAGLHPEDTVELKGIPGYPEKMKVEEIGESFRNLLLDWVETPGHIDCLNATEGDLGNLWPAASLELHGRINIVIFGHTHKPGMRLDKGIDTGDEIPPWEKPAFTIYANSGAWVDGGKYGCTYVETEEVAEKRRHYVRLKKYPGNTSIDEGFVVM